MLNLGGFQGPRVRSIDSDDKRRFESQQNIKRKRKERSEKRKKQKMEKEAKEEGLGSQSEAYHAGTDVSRENA